MPLYTYKLLLCMKMTYMTVQVSIACQVRLDAELAAFHRVVHGRQLISSSLLLSFAMEACRRHAKQARLSRT